jgi:hypothetical protein
MLPDEKYMDDVDAIASMLTYCRPAGSKTEREFIRRFIQPTGAKPDQNSNWLLTIGDNPNVLWSSHTDTVHSRQGRQQVDIVENKMIRLPRQSKSSCLGADCTAGVWIMLEMIKHQVPGLYVFHAAEEIGMVGSKALLRDTPEVLNGIRFAIAFDRRGNDSVITHQSGVRGCSNAFADSIAKQLPTGYSCDPTGSYTDTRVYFDKVDECTNIGVGYQGAHSPHERQDIEHLVRLRDHMIKIDVSKLVAERDAATAMAEWIAAQRRRGKVRYIRENAEPFLDLIESLGVNFSDLEAAIEARRRPVTTIADLFDAEESALSAA